MRLILNFLFILFSLTLSAQGKHIYISPDGDNSNDGSISSPFQSLDYALHIVENQVSSSITLLEGKYFIQNYSSINPKHQNLSILGEEGKEVILSGGIEIPKEDIKTVADTEYASIFKKEIRKHIYFVDLKSKGITDYGELEPRGFGRNSSAPMELFINNDAYHLARFPNDSTILINNLLDPGKFCKEDEDCQEKGGRIQYQTNEEINWTTKKDICIEGYFHHGYAMDAVEVDIWNTEHNSIITKQGHKYGFSSGYDWNRFYAFNILEELDTSNEYYIDREKGILFFYSNEPIKNIELSKLQSPILIFGTNTKNITIKNIIFQSSRSSGIFMMGSNASIIDNCTFRNLGTIAIDLIDTNGITMDNHNNIIQNCKIYQTGAGGIKLSGGNREKLISGNNKIHNCEIHDFNRREKSYKAGIKIEGVGNIISHCKIYNGINQAILLSGNNHTIEYNDIHDVCLDVNDAGAIYYGRNPTERGHVVRYNYFHHIGSENDYQTSAIYHDDGACGMEVYGNIFLQAGSINVFLGGGSDNHYYNNLFLDGLIGIHIDDRLANWNSKFIKEDGLFHQLTASIKYNEAPYSTAYPHLMNYWKENPAIPKRNTFENNIFCEMAALSSTGNSLLDWKENNILTSGYPSIWKKEIQSRDFMPNDQYLPRPAEWKVLPLDMMGLVK